MIFIAHRHAFVVFVYLILHFREFMQCVSFF